MTDAGTSSWQPAVAGSYGTAPSAGRLPDDVRLGAVRLQVADLERSLEYYQRVVGLELLSHEKDRASLGASSVELVELIERPGATPAPGRGRTGLFHFALLLPDRAALGRFARHLGQIGVRVGSADHLVSEAFYLQDPDNLGIEVYADRPRSEWRRVGRELVLVTEPIDLSGLLNAAGDEAWAGVPAGTTMGHVHLHVGDLGGAATFFSEGLGFDRTSESLAGALFLGAGGYHHHLGTNTWAGRFAEPPGRDEAQLVEWTIGLADPGLAAVEERLERQGIATERSAGDGASSLRVRDPWGTPLRLTTAQV